MSVYKGEKLVAGRSVGTYLVRRPAWNKAVEITAVPFTAPDDGTLVLTVGTPGVYGGRNFYIDDIKVGEYQSTSNSVGSMSTLTFPICKGQVLSSKGEYADVWGSYKFVPFEDSTVSESGVEVVTPELIRNLHDPDWSQAITITVDQLRSEYTTPGRGIIVGWILSNLDKMDIKVNDVVIGTSVNKSGSWSSYSSIQIPVNKNDVVKVTQDISSKSMNMSFVPYKAQ